MSDEIDIASGWRWELFEDGRRDRIVDASGNNVLAPVCHGDYGDSIAVSARHAALIADAPAMLELLRRLATAADRMFEEYIDACDRGGFPAKPNMVVTELSDVQSDVRAMIDKHGRD